MLNDVRDRGRIGHGPEGPFYRPQQLATGRHAAMHDYLSPHSRSTGRTPLTQKLCELGRDELRPAINLNLHFHSVVTDGVFIRDTPGERPVFRALPAPTKTDVTALAWEVCQKTTHILRKLGRDSDSDASDADVLARDQPLLAQCYAASLQGFVALGAHDEHADPLSLRSRSFGAGGNRLTAASNRAGSEGHFRP